VVPASPGHYQSRVVGTGAAGVADKALSGHVERTAQPPAGGVEEICRGVLRRGRNDAEFFLFAAPLCGRQTRLELLGTVVQLTRQGGSHVGVDGILAALQFQVRSQSSHLRSPVAL